VIAVIAGCRGPVARGRMAVVVGVIVMIVVIVVVSVESAHVVTPLPVRVK
jgi:hypothetical protein